MYLRKHLRKSYGIYLDFVSYDEIYAIFTNILIITVSRIAFTKNRNLRTNGAKKFVNHLKIPAQGPDHKDDLLRFADMSPNLKLHR